LTLRAFILGELVNPSLYRVFIALHMENGFNKNPDFSRLAYAGLF